MDTKREVESRRMKLSIIIPVYNAVPFIYDLLKVLSLQISKEVEVIVIDDGSTSPLRMELEPHTRIIRQENGGVSKARNRGLEEAKGEYVAFIDADDLVTIDYIESIMKAIEENPDYIYLSWETLPGGWSQKVILQSNEDKFPPFNLCCWNRIYKRSMIGDTRFNESKLIAEDAEFIRKVNEKGKKRATVTHPVYLYRSSTPNSLTKRFNTGELDTKRLVIHYRHITKNMTDVLEKAKEADKDSEVIVLTEQNDIPELEDYAMVLKPQSIAGTSFMGEYTPLFRQLAVPKKAQVVIWTAETMKIGGIETFIEQFCKHMKDYYDIMVLYTSIDANRLYRLSRMVECVKLEMNTHIKCDTLIINRITEKPPKQVEAKRTIQMVHTCQMGIYELPEGRDETVFVSDHAKDTFKGKGKVIHNFVDESDTEHLLLVTASRFTYEKGAERMEKLADALQREGKSFTWLVYTSDFVRWKNENIKSMPPTNNVRAIMRNADYVVQLSDEESFCYSVVEALLEGTPVIATKLPVFKELGIINGKNAILLPLDMSHIPMEWIKPKEKANVIFSYDNKEIEKKWIKLLGKPHPTHSYVPSERIQVETVQPFNDLLEQRNRNKGERFEASPERAEYLMHLGLVRKG